jgi:hypothetical protein
MNVEAVSDRLASPRDDQVTPASIPDVIAAPPGNEVFLVGHGSGTQNYICLPAATGFDWVLFTPQATLFNGEDHQVVTHFFSPSPPESDPTKPVPTWQANDESRVWAAKDAAVPSPTGSIDWLRLKVVAARSGRTGGDRLSDTTYILRVNTEGGTKPETPCTAAASVGSKNCVPYEARYIFYRSVDAEDD